MERGTILVVDDEPNIADLIDLYLAREGFRVAHDISAYSFPALAKAALRSKA